MKCTKVFDTTDKDLYERVKTAYVQENVKKVVEDELKSYKEDDKYKVSDYNKEYAMILAKRAITGVFEADEDKTPAATAVASATPVATEAPKVEDAEIDKTVVAKYRGEDIYKSYFSQFFSQAINECLSDYDFTEINSIQDEKEYYKALKDLLGKEYKDGKTYIDYSKEEALNIMLKFFATKDMAVAADKALSDAKKKDLLTELDGQFDSMLMYYGEAYDLKTRDELVQKIAGMNVNDYKLVYLDQMLLSEYSESVMDDIETDEVELKTFYEKDVDSYRIVTIRMITKSLLNSKDELVSEEEQAKIEKLINTLKDKYDNGDSIEALAVGYSDNIGSNKGLVDLTNKSVAVTRAVCDWAFEQTELGVATVIKTDSSYELVVIEGLADYDGIKGNIATEDFKIDSIHEAVENGYKSDVFEEQVEKYIKDNNLTLEDTVEDVMDAVVEDYLSHLDDEINKEDKESDSK